MGPAPWDPAGWAPFGGGVIGNTGGSGPSIGGSSPPPRAQLKQFGTTRRSSYTRPSPPPSSSGLGHHPLKVAARVRIPLGVPTQGRRSGPLRRPFVVLRDSFRLGRPRWDISGIRAPRLAGSRRGRVADRPGHRSQRGTTGTRGRCRCAGGAGLRGRWPRRSPGDVAVCARGG
jgi:hypothetical protein